MSALVRSVYSIFFDIRNIRIRLRTVSLIEFFFFFFFWGGGGGGGGGAHWSYVHHTVDVKVLYSDVVRPSGCPFIFSVHAVHVFDDPFKIIWRQLPEIDVMTS